MAETAGVHWERRVGGAPVALLLAPQSGRESREQLREYVQRAEETDHEQADIATQTLAFNHRSIHTDSPKIT
jgi:gas vesicle protein